MERTWIMSGVDHLTRMATGVKRSTDAPLNQPSQSPGQKMKNVPMEHFVYVLQGQMASHKKEGGWIPSTKRTRLSERRFTERHCKVWLHLIGSWDGLAAWNCRRIQIRGTYSGMIMPIEICRGGGGVSTLLWRQLEVPSSEGVHISLYHRHHGSCDCRGESTFFL